MLIIWVSFEVRAGAPNKDMRYFVIPYLKKQLDKIVLHVGTNDASHSKPLYMFQDIQEPQLLVWKYLPAAKIIISTPVLSLDYILHENIQESHIDKYGLHINKSGTLLLFDFWYLQFMMSSGLQWRIKKQIKVYVNYGINQTL